MTALEYALVAPLFFLVLFMGIEVIFMLLADSTLDTAASRITRMGKIGQFQGQDCHNKVMDQLRNELSIWADTTNLHADAKIYKPGENNSFQALDQNYTPVCDTGDRGDMVIFRLGFDKPGLTGVIHYLGLDVFRFERIVVIQNEP
ncbi:TadE family protein [Castellaniella sp. MT123]|uniref:TadE/TadG family type IV pilus assembly protein n=1 Tax=Castellaniella sp. MT123 TaxID=3140381 RepID=UPI0031F45716